MKKPIPVGHPALAPLFALLLLGCSPSGEASFKEMKSAACKRDVKGFFKYVDKDRLSRRLAAKGAPRQPMGGAMSDSDVEYRSQKVYAEWEEDILKGDKGEWCNMTLVRASRSDEGAESVDCRTKKGELKSLSFWRFGDRYRLSGM